MQNVNIICKIDSYGTGETRAGSYKICDNSGASTGDHTPVIVTRSIPLTAYLPSIPQSQLDGLQMTDDEKAAYQNPGY